MATKDIGKRAGDGDAATPTKVEKRKEGKGIYEKVRGSESTNFD